MSNLGKNLVDARSNLIDMHLIQSLKNEFSFDFPIFSKYPATSINSYFYKMTLCNNEQISTKFLFMSWTDYSNKPWDFCRNFLTFGFKFMSLSHLVGLIPKKNTLKLTQLASVWDSLEEHQRLCLMKALIRVVSCSSLYPEIQAW